MVLLDGKCGKRMDVAGKQIGASIVKKEPRLGVASAHMCVGADEVIRRLSAFWSKP